MAPRSAGRARSASAPGEKLHESLLTVDECSALDRRRRRVRRASGAPLVGGESQVVGGHARCTTDSSTARTPTTNGCRRDQLRAPAAVIPYGRQSIDDDDIAAVVEVLRGDWLTQGPPSPSSRKLSSTVTGARRRGRVRQRHRRPPRRGCRRRARAGRPSSRTSPLTFMASANCARYVGASVALVDIDPETLNLDPAGVGQDVDALVAVHYAGLPVDLSALTHRPRVVIEDAAHALGALDTRRTGRQLRAQRHVLLLFPSGEADHHRRRRSRDDELRRATPTRLRRFRSHGIVPSARTRRLVLRDRRARLQLPAHRHPGRARASPARASSTASSPGATRSPSGTASCSAVSTASSLRLPHSRVPPRLPPLPGAGSRSPAHLRRLRAAGFGCRCTTCRSTTIRSAPTSRSGPPTSQCASGSTKVCFRSRCTQPCPMPRCGTSPASSGRPPQPADGPSNSAAALTKSGRHSKKSAWAGVPRSTSTRARRPISS